MGKVGKRKPILTKRKCLLKFTSYLVWVIIAVMCFVDILTLLWLVSVPESGRPQSILENRYQCKFPCILARLIEQNMCNASFAYCFFYYQS